MAQLDDRDQLARRVNDLQKQEEKLVLRYADVACARGVLVCVCVGGGGTRRVCCGSEAGESVVQRRQQMNRRECRENEPLCKGTAGGEAGAQVR
jgi:hypothetical protein